MATYFVTGGSRGIGFGFCERLSREGSDKVYKIYAAARTETSQLRDLIDKSAGLVEFLETDVTSEQSVKHSAQRVEKSLEGRGLDVLINVVGSMPNTPGGIAAMDDLMETFQINVLGVHLVTQNLLPLLQKGPTRRIVNISSPSGSIAMAPTFERFGQRAPTYQIAKAGLNRLTVQYALEYEKQGFVVVAVSPGWVATEMGGENTDLDVETSVNAMLDILDKITLKDSGKFFNIHVPGWEHAEGLNQYDGKKLPW